MTVEEMATATGMETATMTDDVRTHAAEVTATAGRPPTRLVRKLEVDPHPRQAVAQRKRRKKKKRVIPTQVQMTTRSSILTGKKICC